MESIKVRRASLKTWLRRKGKKWDREVVWGPIFLQTFDIMNTLHQFKKLISPAGLVSGFVTPSWEIISLNYSVKGEGLMLSQAVFKSLKALRFGLCFFLSWASLVAQLVKNLPAMQETWVWSLGWEDPVEKGKAANSSILAWRIPWTL